MEAGPQPPWEGGQGSCASPKLGFGLPVAKYSAHAALPSSCRAWHLGVGVELGFALGGDGAWLVAAVVWKGRHLAGVGGLGDSWH